MKLQLLAGLGVLMLSGCAAVPQQEALDLAASGAKTTAAASASLQGMAKDVSALSERTLIEDTLVDCDVALRPRKPKAPPPPVSCAPGTMPSDATMSANRNLARVISKRSQMFDALGDAYGAFDAEASYDARGDLEGAIGELGQAGQNLSTAFAIAGSPLSTASLSAITPIAARIGGLSAQEAQKRRLIAASQSIKAAVKLSKDAVEKEAGLYAAIAGTLETRRTALIDRLLRSRMIDPKVPMQAFAADLGVTLSPDLKSNNPRLLAAARATARYRAHAATLARQQVYLKLAATLEKLAAQHDAFEKEVVNSSKLQFDQALAELQFWVEALAKLEAASDPDLASKVTTKGDAP